MPQCTREIGVRILAATMAHHIHQNFTAFGVSFHVAASDAELWSSLTTFLPYGSRPCQDAAESSRAYSFVREGETYSLRSAGILVRRGSLPQVLQAFESDAQLFIAEHSPCGIFVHAGVVGWKNRALLFPGRSLSGKSTLVAELLRAGATYYSDEFAVVENDGRVLPYPRLLSLRQEDGSTRKVEATTFGAETGEQALPVGAIFVCRFEAGAVWNPRGISPGEALLALLDNTVAARSRAPEVMQTLKKVVASSPAYQSPRGEAETIVSEISK